MEELKLISVDIDTAVEKLLEAKAEGRHVFLNFNGVKLYSDNVTLDSAYIEILGCTKREWKKKIEKQIEESDKQMKVARENAINNIPNLIKKGQKLIYPFRQDKWIESVESDAIGDYCGFITASAMEVMTAIDEEKPIEELMEIFDKQGHSGWSASLTRNVVMTYSKNGYPFYATVHPFDWTEEECEAILKIIEDNEKHSKDLRIANSVVESKKEVTAIQKRLVISQNKEHYNS